MCSVPKGRRKAICYVSKCSVTRVYRLNSEISAIQSVGLDYCGPVYLKDSTRNASIKAWISIFSCCTLRAIHIELVPDLMTNAFIRALKRFIGRRGSPSLIISDNARTFTSAYRVLSLSYKLAEVQSFLASKKINWHFILQKSPSYAMEVFMNVWFNRSNAILGRL